MATPSNQTEFVVRRQAFNFDTFQKDKLAKKGTAPQVDSVAAALALKGNDEKALVSILNKGLLADAKDAAWEAQDGWTVAEKNLPSEKKYEGTIVNPGGVLTMVRTLAMTIFGMTPEMPKDEKKARRQKALDFIKSNDAIREGLKNQALSASEDEDEEDID